jgi:hypothetical protein
MIRAKEGEEFGIARNVARSLLGLAVLNTRLT